MDVRLSQTHYPHPRTPPNLYSGQSLLLANPERDFLTMADSEYNAEEAAGMITTYSICLAPQEKEFCQELGFRINLYVMRGASVKKHS